MIEPNNTAVRVALWRALHLIVDDPPHVFCDDVGLQLAAPDDSWRNRPDMSPFTKPFRASILARSRFIEDVVADSNASQYVILGAGLDTFVQRHPEFTSSIQVFEIDQPETQNWKRSRLRELGYDISPNQHFVPVDFEAGESWWKNLALSGFNPKESAVVASAGVSMYLTKDAIFAKMKHVAKLAPGSVFIMSFLLPVEMADPEIRPGIERSIQGAQANGTPFLSFFMPDEIVALAREAGLKSVEYISAESLATRYFANRNDGLRPPKNAEELIMARV